jgi:hypothetical protein
MDTATFTPSSIYGTKKTTTTSKAKTLLLKSTIKQFKIFPLYKKPFKKWRNGVPFYVEKSNSTIFMVSREDHLLIEAPISRRFL